ncbi:VWA domain-containing protein [Metapseudomonas lalkuanensis]|uniref:VWA domain-containing protein n=1 Tax=Metapseudomonas lalkuanensis TaxID=2604832 RepID=A0A5J6QM12_9GAMM|nr:VWA domain-containing protein [Pseudomonas lalkuanensis]QEY62301.1 VWA domain-containing protein [Pseudomonas lalkuanensis]UCP00153.1 VWA domain-containing protein [Pseudomonas lalkuanensis]
MMELWPHWLRPAWLLLLPLLGWLLWQLWHRERRSGRWEQLLPRAFQPWLLSGGRLGNNRLPWMALGLAWLLCLAALLGPSWQLMEQSTQKRADPLVVMLELTPSMLATDIAPSRLEQAKRKLRDLLDARRDAQTAIIVYAGSAHSLVPLSDDLMTSLNLIDALKPSIMPEKGHRADLAVARALKLLEQGAQGQGRLLLVTSGLDDQEQTGIRKTLGSRSERLAILGIGTAAGAPIAQEDGGFLKDDQGAILLPKLDSGQLRRFAAELGGRYSNVQLDEDDLRDLGLLDGPGSLRDTGEIARLADWADQGHWLLLPLLLIAACAGRRGWLFCLPLLLVLPRPSLAMDFEDLWLRPDQQGQRLLQAQQPAEAAQHFNDPRWQGMALYQAGDYAEAAARFAQGDNAADHYNRGNALAQAGELEAAVDAYDSALQRQPDLAAAKKNKALVEELLRQRAAEASSNDPDQQGSEQQQTGQTGEQSTAQTQSGEQNADNESPQQGSGETPPGGQTRSATGGSAEEATPTDAAQAQTASTEPLGEERRQALEQWLRQIPDDPAELLRRKFWYEQQQRQEEQ